MNTIESLLRNGSQGLVPDPELTKLIRQFQKFNDIFTYDQFQSVIKNIKDFTSKANEHVIEAELRNLILTMCNLLTFNPRASKDHAIKITSSFEYYDFSQILAETVDLLEERRVAIDGGSIKRNVSNFITLVYQLSDPYDAFYDTQLGVSQAVLQSNMFSYPTDCRPEIEREQERNDNHSIAIPSLLFEDLDSLISSVPSYSDYIIFIGHSTMNGTKLKFNFKSKEKNVYSDTLIDSNLLITKFSDTSKLLFFNCAPKIATKAKNEVIFNEALVRYREIYPFVFSYFFFRNVWDDKISFKYASVFTGLFSNYAEYYQMQ